MKKLKNILITGANGQLALCIKKISASYPDYNFHFKTSSELDITQESDIKKIFNDLAFEYCINCAAYTAVDKAESEKEKTYRVNAEAVKYLAKVCFNHKTILIHISTDFIFDGLNTSPYLEEDKPNPISVYGASKLKGEEYIKTLLTNFFIIRTSWVYSEYGNNFVKTMLRLGNERDELSVVNDQKGSPTYAGDLAEVLLEIISKKNDKYGTYNYSNEGSTTWYNFAKEIFKLKSIKINLKAIPASDFPTPAQRPVYSVLNKTKIKSNFGFQINNWKSSLEKHFKNEN